MLTAEQIEDVVAYLADAEMTTAGTTTRRNSSLLAGAPRPPATARRSSIPTAAQRKAALDAAIRKVVGDAPVRRGRVKLEVPPLIDNGNSVPLVGRGREPDDRGRPRQGDPRLHREESAAERGRALYLGPRAGRAQHRDPRPRSPIPQTVIAIAQMTDGSFWSDSADVVVTLAACLEEG